MYKQTNNGVNMTKRAKMIQQTSIEMTSSATRIDRLGQARFSTDTGDARLDALNARLNKVNEFMEELAVDLLDNTVDQPSSYYAGSLRKLNAEEAAILKAEIQAELGE
jgi:hypothetical protein